MATPVYISVEDFGKAEPTIFSYLKDQGLDLDWNRSGRPLQREEVVPAFGAAVGILAGVEPIDRVVMEAVPSLRVISRFGSGLDSIDLEAAQSRRIRVFSTPDAPVPAVAEFTIGLMLGVLRQIPRVDQDLRSGTWRGRMGGLLRGKCVGIVGLGRIGREVVRLLQGFQVRIIASEPEPIESFCRDYSIDLVSLEDLVAWADIVTIHASLTEQTVGLFSPAIFQKVKPGAYLVNTARGRIVHLPSLLEALNSGRLSGAAIDTFDPEPYAGPLLRHPHFLGTPHMASRAWETWRDLEVQSARNLVRGLEEEGML